jgi:hypothetical protein
LGIELFDLDDAFGLDTFGGGVWLSCSSADIASIASWSSGENKDLGVEPDVLFEECWFT